MSSQPDAIRPDQPPFVVGGIRIDQAHPGHHGAPHSTGEGAGMQLVAVAEAQAGEVAVTVERSLDQLREHAAELADRLQSEQVALDRR